jgi:mono/diheme cytochrome c family protein
MKTTTQSTTRVFAWLLLLAAAPALRAAAPADRPALIERGRYIVERVGLCSDCHTPHNEKGELVRAQLLLGAALPFKPTVPMPWSPVAPPIAGLPSMTEAQGIAFLQTGKRPDGSQPRPPMPEFRLNEADASAVVAYLKSLAK